MNQHGGGTNSGPGLAAGCKKPAWAIFPPRFNEIPIPPEQTGTPLVIVAR